MRKGGLNGGCDEVAEEWIRARVRWKTLVRYPTCCTDRDCDVGGYLFTCEFTSAADFNSMFLGSQAFHVKGESSKG